MTAVHHEIKLVTGQHMMVELNSPGERFGMVVSGAVSVEEVAEQFSHDPGVETSLLSGDVSKGVLELVPADPDQ
jgi:hypothetical protein